MPSLNWDKIEAWLGIWLLLPVILKWVAAGIAVLCLLRVCLDRYGRSGRLIPGTADWEECLAGPVGFSYWMGDR